MTYKKTDEANSQIESQEAENETEAEIIDVDPMVIEMQEAEAEIKALEEAKQESDTGKEAEKPNGEEAEKDVKNDSEAGKAEDENGKNNPMIPKARFDQVLAERDLAREQAGYMKGFVAGSQKDVNDLGQEQKNENGDKEDNKSSLDQDGIKIDDIDTAIDLAEEKKLDLAEKYDEGEISTREWKKAELKIDKEIRGLSKQRIDNVSKESKVHIDTALNAQHQEAFIEQQALNIQQNHHNIASIDKLPEATSNALWNSINHQAAINLMNRGVNLQDNSPQARLTLIQEKAALTDQLTQENISALLMGAYQFVDPSQYKAPSQENTSHTPKEKVKTGMSDKAKNLSEKLDLANSQPPSIADMGQGNDTGELTEAALEAMTDDQVADLLEKAPQLIQRILVNTN